MLSSEDAGHRDWRNVRKNNLQNMAKEPEIPTTTILITVLHACFKLSFIEEDAHLYMLESSEREKNLLRFVLHLLLPRLMFPLT